jgi:hypothetical protein
LVTGQIMHLSHNYTQAPEPVQQPAAKCTADSIITDQECPPPPPPPRFNRVFRSYPSFSGARGGIGGGNQRLGWGSRFYGQFEAV